MCVSESVGACMCVSESVGTLSLCLSVSLSPSLSLSLSLPPSLSLSLRLGVAGVIRVTSSKPAFESEIRDRLRDPCLQRT